MKNTEAILAGAIILTILANLSKPDTKKQSVILLSQAIRAKIKHASKTTYAEAADTAFNVAKEESKKEELLLDIGIIIETIAFDLLDEMKTYYGNNIITLIERAASKVTITELEHDMKRKSYDIADLIVNAIKEEARKIQC
jgi:hypothetical protein